MSSSKVTTKFEMQDGRVLSCEYEIRCTPGNTWGAPENCYPDEYDSGEPEFFIDGEEVAYEELPKGLCFKADEMLQAGPGQFNYSQSEWEDEGGYYDDCY